jgi:hypothetical protein
VERKAHGLLYHCCWYIQLAFSELNYLHHTPLTWVWKNTKSVIAVLLQFTLFHAAKPLLFVSWYLHLIFRKGQGWWWQIVLQEDFFSQAVLIDWCITFGKWGDGFCGDFQVQWKDVEFFAQESRLRLCQFYKSLKRLTPVQSGFRFSARLVVKSNWPLRGWVYYWSTLLKSPTAINNQDK